MATYLVTGGAGFIGSHIVDELVRRHERVRILDNLSTGRMANLDGVLGQVEFVHGDIRDYKTVKSAVTGADFVMHHAALASVPGSIADPLMTNEVNITGTLNVLMAARDVGVKRLVFASSSSVYGDGSALPKREDMQTRPLSPYAVSKLAGEAYGLAFYEIYGLPVVCLRYFNVFGPRQDPTSQYSAVIPKFITAMQRGESPVIYGDGMQSRDFIYVANVVNANILACEHATATGSIINIACGKCYTLIDLCHELQGLLGSAITPTYAPARVGDVKYSMAEIAEASAKLGYAPEVDFHEGLRRTVGWNMCPSENPTSAIRVSLSKQS
jgi:nucleoside-diphosphate-sugar epimerase